uniref:Cell surface hydrophobicity-associated protein n=1 Tax=Ganoderma boninense TaxID=34458 RepID=A0A5K1K311_9APHY
MSNVESSSKDVDSQPSNAVILFRATWDYIPMPILKLFRYLPGEPFTRMRSLRNLFQQYGKHILREHSPEVVTGHKVNGEDILTVLDNPHSALTLFGSSYGIACTSQRERVRGANTRLDDEELIAEMASLTFAPSLVPNPAASGP